MDLVISEELVLLFAQPILLFVFSILAWSLQSFFVTGISRRFIFPHLYRNAVTTYGIAQVSIIIHEASHFFSAIFTGSSIVKEESFITPTSGRVTAASEESVFGWFSRMVAALAPSFIPPILFLIVFFAVSGLAPELMSGFQYPKTAYDFQSMLAAKFYGTLVPNISLFVSAITDLTSPVTFLLIYLLIVCSIAAGPSEGDWRSTLDLFLSPVSIISLLVLYLFLNLAFSQFNLGFVVPLILLISFTFAVVAIGVIYAFLVSQLLSLAYRNAGHALALLIFFLAAYYTVFYFSQDTSISFGAALAPSIALGYTAGRLNRRRSNHK